MPNYGFLWIEIFENNFSGPLFLPVFHWQTEIHGSLMYLNTLMVYPLHKFRNCCLKNLSFSFFSGIFFHILQNSPSWIVESHHHFIKLISWSEVLKSEISAGWFYARASRDESHFWAKPFLKSILNNFSTQVLKCFRTIELFMT